MKDTKNPIAVGPSGTACYAGPSNLWASADNKSTYLEMIFNTTTGLFKSVDKDLHSWELVNGNFYPTRGGGGGLFYKLPTTRFVMQNSSFFIIIHRFKYKIHRFKYKTRPPGAATSVDAAAAGTPAYTHMLQSDFPGQPDGAAFYVLGIYDEEKATFDSATGADEPRALDFSGFEIQNSSFLIQSSSFLIQNSPFLMQNSGTYVFNQLGLRSDGTMVNVGWIRNMGTSVVREVTYDPAFGGQLRE